MMNELFGEFLGTLILILLGNGVVAGVVPSLKPEQQCRLVVITMGWGLQLRLRSLLSGKLSQLI